MAGCGWDGGPRTVRCAVVLCSAANGSLVLVLFFPTFHTHVDGVMHVCRCAPPPSLVSQALQQVQAQFAMAAGQVCAVCVCACARIVPCCRTLRRSPFPLFVATPSRCMCQVMTNTCFERCITRPGSSLTGSEKSCLMGCKEAFSGCLQITQERVAKRVVRGVVRGRGSETAFPRQLCCAFSLFMFVLLVI